MSIHDITIIARDDSSVSTSTQTGNKDFSKLEKE
jgi:hypothetical protein